MRITFWIARFEWILQIVGYIYFTRIIVYFLSVTVPFSHQWVVDLCREVAVFTFYVLTGYMFRPASNNPYMRVAIDENGDMDDADDEEGGEVVLMDQMYVFTSTTSFHWNTLF